MVSNTKKRGIDKLVQVIHEILFNDIDTLDDEDSEEEGE